jgi:hypothetical protein
MWEREKKNSECSKPESSLQANLIISYVKFQEENLIFADE